MELMVCVSSAEALREAVTAGADAVRVGLKGCSASGITADEIKKAAVWCRVRGARLSVSMDAPLSGSSFAAALDAATDLARGGASAICVGDVGFLRALRLLLPSLPLEASERLGISDAAGTRLLEALGARRLLLPPQLSRSELSYLCARTKLETEAVLCGRVCPALGDCRISAFVGEGGICGKECRERYVCLGQNGEKRPAIKSILLSEHLEELTDFGLTALSLRCEGQRPDCAAAMADIFRRALMEEKPPSQRDLQYLERHFFPEGGTDALFRGSPEEALLPPQGERHWPGLGRGSYERSAAEGEFQRVPVTITAELKRGNFSRIVVTDPEGRSAGATGPIPQPAGDGKRELTSTLLRSQLLNTIGTPFYCAEVTVQADSGLHLGTADIGQMRREALNRLSDKRSELPPLRLGELPPLLRSEIYHAAPDISVSVKRAAQLSEALAALKPKVLYVPLGELLRFGASVTPFWENGVTSVCAVLPKRYSASEAAGLFTDLKNLKDLHITDVLAESWNSLLPAGMMGFRLRCGLGLQVWNDWSLRVLRELGAVSAMLSPELSLGEIAKIAKCMDTELFAYGRLPLLTGEASLAADGEESDTLRDRRGRQFPVLNELGRSTLYAPDKLFLGDRLKELQGLGIWCLHLSFTTENAGECAAAAERYLGMGSYVPNFKTKGLYYENETHSGLRLPPQKGSD